MGTLHQTPAKAEKSELHLEQPLASKRLRSIAQRVRNRRNHGWVQLASRECRLPRAGGSDSDRRREPQRARSSSTSASTNASSTKAEGSQYTAFGGDTASIRK